MWQFARRRDFTGGENRLVLPEFMQDNQLILAQNCVSTAEGTLETRLGKTQVNDSTLGSGGIISMHRYAKEGGSEYLVVQHGTSLYSASWDGSSAISTFGTAIKTGLSGAKLRSVVWKDVLILSDGAANPFYFNGSTCTDLGGTPGAFSIFCVYAGRLWMVPAATPNQIKFSNLEDYDTWDALDIIKIRDADGDQITGLSPQEGGIFVTKNKSVWPIYGTSRHNITVATAPLLESIGCVSQDCLLDAGMFLGQDSLYGFSLNEVTPTGETHRTLIESLTAAEKAAAYAQVIPKEQRAILVISSTVLNLDARYKSITSWSGLNIGCMCVADADGDPGTLLIGDADNGFIYSLDNTTDDDGTAIQTIITTPNDDMGSVRKKVWRYFQPEIEPKGSLSNVVYYKYNVDYSTQSGSIGLDQDYANILDWGVDNWNEAVWGTATKIKDPFWLHGVRGDTISFTITATDRIKFSGYLTKFREAGAL